MKLRLADIAKPQFLFAAVLIVGFLAFLALLISLENHALQKSDEEIRAIARNQLTDELKFGLKTSVDAMIAGLEYLGKAQNTVTNRDQVIKDIVRYLDANKSTQGLYFFALYESGVIIAAPENPSLEGSNMLDATDVNGYPVFRELIKSAQNGGGFVSFLWLNPSSKQVEPKLCYAAPLHLGDQEIVLGTGAYLPTPTGGSDRTGVLIGTWKRQMQWSSSVFVLLLVFFASGAVLIGYKKCVATPLKTIMTGLSSIPETTDQAFRFPAQPRWAATDIRDMYQVLLEVTGRYGKQIDSLRAAQQQDRLSLEKYQEAFHSLPVSAGFIYHKEGCFIELNQSLVEQFGYTRTDLEGFPIANWDLWVDPDQWPEIAVSLDKVNGPVSADLYWRAKNGTEYPGVLSAQNIEVDGEKLTIFTWNNIADRHDDLPDMSEACSALEVQNAQYASDLALAQKDLALALDNLKETRSQALASEKLASLGSLVPGVVHEISTPVGLGVTAASNLERIAAGFKDSFASGQIKRQDLQLFIEDCETAVSIILNNLNRASRLLGSFKQVSVDQSSENRRSFNLKRYLEEILLSLNPRIKKTQQRVEIICDDNIEIDSYPGAYAQLFTNLVVNSLTHGFAPSDPGLIRVEVSRSGDYLHILYSDDGRGMSPEVLERIFDPYFTTRSGSGGSGLGMHIVKTIVTSELQGRIECASEPGNGTRFIITLPVQLS